MAPYRRCQLRAMIRLALSGAFVGQAAHRSCTIHSEHMKIVESLPLSKPLVRKISVAVSIQWLALFLLLLEVVTAPLLYGAVLPEGKFLLEILAFSTALLAMTSAPRLSLGQARWPVGAMVGVATLGVMQFVPLPHAWIVRLSPNSALLYERTEKVIPLFGRPSLVWRISVSPVATVSASLLVAAYASLFVAASLLCTSRNRRRLVQGTVIASGVFHAGLAAMTEAPIDRIHGPFVNPNHLAGYLEISLCLAFGFLWTEMLVSRERGSRLAEKRERLERQLLSTGWRVILWSLVAAALALTRSRGGIAAAVVTTVVIFGLALTRRDRERKRSMASRGVATLLAGFTITALAVGRYPLLRFLVSDPRDPSSDLRTTLWRVSLSAWKSFPLLGSGLGAFQEAFRLVQPSELPLLVEQAHNSFLQMLVTGGIAGAALSSLATFSLMAILLRAWNRELHREERSLLLAAVGVLISLSLHDLVEFNFSVPAIPATVAIAIGAAWAGRTTHAPSPAAGFASAD